MSRRTLAIALFAAASTAAADTVERRGREPALEGDITIKEAGVEVRSALGAVHVVPWDRVRRVEMRSPEPGLEERLAAATELWRARSRVERGDTALAEPQLERHFEGLRGKTHETALVAAEGLLRCRLARGDHVLAVVPALEVARLRRAGVTTSSYAQLDPVYDEETALCPDLPPAWPSPDRLDALAHDLATYDAQADPVVAANAGLYRRAVTQAIGRRGEPAAAQALPDHPGVELMELLVACGGGTEAQAAARTQLARRLAALPGWREAWARYFLGRSLLPAASLKEREEGALHLVHVPARFDRTQPYLGALCLAEVAGALDRDGDGEAAERIRAVPFPAGGADDVESFLERHGLDRLLAVHLEARLESQTGSEKQETVLRLAERYAALLEKTTDPARRADLEERSHALLAMASASAGQDLRLALLRGQYRQAEQIAENHRLRQSTPEDVESARALLSDIVPKLTRLRNQIAERLDVTDRRLRRAIGAEAADTVEDAERLQALYAQCTFVTAWALYYQSWLHGRPDNARAAEELFATLVGSDSPRPQPQDISIDLRSEEAVSRAILGMALCKSLTTTSATAIQWLDLLSHEQSNAALREQAPAWRMAVHLEHGEYGLAAPILAAAATREEPPPVAWLRLAAVYALEAGRGNPQAEALARQAVAQLAARGELQSVLDLCDRYGVEALGAEGFATRYVRGVRHYQQARREHGGEQPTADPRLARLYAEAAAEFEAASGQGDADRYPAAAASCRRLIGWCEFFAGRFAAARRSFELAAEHLAPGESADALWMAVVSLDRAVQAGDAPPAELDALIGAVLARYPTGPYAARLRLKRALDSPPSQEAVEELLSIEPGSAEYETARRRAAGMLYELFRGASGTERAARGSEFLAVAMPLIDAAVTDVEARAALLRRVLEVALADDVGRAAAAERALDALSALGGEPGADLSAYADEIDFRRVQAMLAAGSPDRAAAIADGLWQRDRESSWSRLAQGALFSDALRRFEQKKDRAWLDLAIRHGRRVVSEFADDPEGMRRPRVLAAHAALAEALLEAGAGDSASDREALALYEKLLAARPADASFLHGTAILSERLGKTDQALGCWRTLVAGMPAGDPLWYEAKFRLISLLAETDPPRARAVMDQHKLLNPTYGPEPWATRLSELDRRIPAEAAPS